jgi:hypothetical protein
MRYTNGEQRYIHNDEVTFLLVRDELMKYADKSCLQGLIANAVNKEVERRLFGFTGKFCVLFWRKEDAEVVMWGRPADPSPFPDPKSKHLQADVCSSSLLQPRDAQVSPPTLTQCVAKLLARRRGRRRAQTCHKCWERVELIHGAACTTSRQPRMEHERASHRICIDLNSTGSHGWLHDGPAYYE